MSANFTPSKNSYKDLGQFRFWCQKVLPVVYDDSLSYYELLCKVVNYLNETIENVDLMGEDIQKLHTAYVQLEEWVNSYFDNLDVQNEINNKLNDMAVDGSLSTLIQPMFDTYKEIIDESVNLQNEMLASIRGVVDDNKEELEGEMDVLAARMNVFTSLGNGSTTGDAELKDIRVGADGVTYGSAGEAVRKNIQVRNISSENVEKLPEIKLPLDDVKEAIATKGAETLESIPDDYTALSERVEQLSEDILFSDFGLVGEHLPFAINTNDYLKKKYVVREDGCTTVRFHVNKNTTYKITDIGTHNRFRFYGRYETDNFSTDYDHTVEENRAYIDEIIADNSNVEGIDNFTEYVFNSGDCQTIYVYASTSTTFNPNILIYSNPNNADSYLRDNAKLFTKNIVDFPDNIKYKGKYGNIFKPWKAYNEEDMSTWQAYTYQELIDNVYEPLRQKYPTYITRSIIGRDTSNTHDIYQYTFEPDYYEQTCYLQSGVHPREEDAWIGLGLLLKHICEDWETDEALSYLRWGVKMIVVPVVNVWGVSQPVEERHDVNVNGVNLNRDTVDKTQEETVVVTGFIDSIANELSFALDFHTTVNDSYGDYMLTVFSGEKNEFIAKRTLYMLARKNACERLESYRDKYALGINDLSLTNVGDSVNTGTYVQYFKTKGVSGATVEHSDFVWDTSRCTSKSITKAVECFGNQLIQHAENKIGSLV